MLYMYRTAENIRWRRRGWGDPRVPPPSLLIIINTLYMHTVHTLAPKRSPTAITTLALRLGWSFGQTCFSITLTIFHPDISTASSVT